MGDQQSRGAFWTSLPGVLTGAAALVTAISGLAIWHNKSAPEPKPEPAPIVQPAAQPTTPSVQPASQPQVSSTAASTAEPGSKPWCAAKYKAWADEKAQTGVDNAALRKAIIGNHCNTKYGFALGRIKPQQ